jgi:putative copper resistance protein D
VILRVIHLLAASIWLGSMVFFAVVIVPVVRRSFDPEKRKEVIKAIGFRYRILGYSTILILLVTGPLLAIGHGVDWHSNFGTVLTYKLILIAMMLIFLFLHDFIFAPKTLNEKGAPREGDKNGITLLARITLLIVIMIMLCGVLLTTV